MDRTTTSIQADDGSAGTADKPGTAHRTRRRVLLAVGAAAILVAGAGADASASRSGPLVAKAKSMVSTLSGITDTVIKGDLQGQTLVSGTLRYSDPCKLESGFEGVLIQMPVSGAVLTQGDTLYRTGNETTYLIHGNLPAQRSFEASMEDDENVRQLETVLKDLRCFDYEPDDHFSWATTNAILKWQKDFDLSWTGTLPLGQIVFTPGDLHMGTITARVGDHVAADTELFDAIFTTQVVDINIRLSNQKLAIVGTAVTTKLPDAKKTAGEITSAGTPTEKSSGSGSGTGSGSSLGESKERIIPITVTLTDVSATTNFQEASVTINLPSKRRMGVLPVPVGALLALSADQYGVEIVEADGAIRRVSVTIGLFAGGCMEIPGQDVSEGQQAVVPQTRVASCPCVT